MTDSNISSIIDIINNVEDLQVKNSQIVDSNIVVEVEFSEDGSSILVKCIPSDNDTYNLEFKAASGVLPDSVLDVEAKNIPNKIKDVMQSDEIASATSTSNISAVPDADMQVKFISESKHEVNLVKVFANYDPGLVLADLGTVLDSEEFVSSIPDGESTYAIAVADDDSISIDPVSELWEQTSEIDGLDVIVRQLLTIRKVYEWYFWNTTEISKLHDYLDINFNWLVSGQMSDIVVFYKTRYPESTISYPEIDSTTSYNLDNLTPLINSVQVLIDAYDAYYCNFSHDEQMLIDGHIRNLRKVQTDLSSYNAILTSGGAI